MAIDKAVDSAALEAGLTKVANAIRTKGGTSAQLAFPDGMAEAVKAIEVGGGAKEPYIEFIYTSNTQTAIRSAKMHGYVNVPSNLFYCSSTIEDLDMPEGVTNIDYQAFYQCWKLALTSLPESVTNIGYQAFYQCWKLTLTSLPEGVTNIRNYAFSQCTGLKEITFKGTPGTIESGVFDGCTHLLTINVPWAEGAVANAPWGATNATINYNYVEAG